MKTDGKLVDEENKAEGVVSSKVYLDYAKVLGGWKVWTAIFVTFVASQIVYMYQSWWLRTWSIHSENDTAMLRSAVTTMGQAIDTSHLSQLPGVRNLIGAVKYVSLSMNRVDKVAEQHSTLYYITIYGIIDSLMVSQHVLES